MSNQPIDIRIRGARASIPTGKLLGRIGTGVGEIQLLDLSHLRSMGVATTADIANNVKQPGFGFFAGGLLLNNEFLGVAVFSVDVTFTSGDPDAIITCLTAATNTAVFNLLAVIAGVPTNVGTITFAPGAFKATIAWSGGSYTLPAATQLRLYAPTPNDVTLGDISGLVVGAEGI